MKTSLMVMLRLVLRPVLMYVFKEVFELAHCKAKHGSEPVAEVVSSTTAGLYDELPVGVKLYAAPVPAETSTPGQKMSAELSALVSVDDLKNKVVSTLRAQKPLRSLTSESSTDEVRHYLGYNECIDHFEQIWRQYGGNR